MLLETDGLWFWGHYYFLRRRASLPEGTQLHSTNLQSFVQIGLIHLYLPLYLKLSPSDQASDLLLVYIWTITLKGFDPSLDATSSISLSHTRGSAPGPPTPAVPSTPPRFPWAGALVPAGRAVSTVPRSAPSALIGPWFPTALKSANHDKHRG